MTLVEFSAHPVYACVRHRMRPKPEKNWASIVPLAIIAIDFAAEVPGTSDVMRAPKSQVRPQNSTIHNPGSWRCSQTAAIHSSIHEGTSIQPSRYHDSSWCPFNAWAGRLKQDFGSPVGKLFSWLYKAILWAWLHLIVWHFWGVETYCKSKDMRPFIHRYFTSSHVSSLRFPSKTPYKLRHLDKAA